MFASLVHHVEPLLENYGALGVFLASIIEEIIAPIPSSVVVFTAGLLLTKNLTGMAAVMAILLKVMLPAALGITIGSLFPYFLARIGEKVVVERFGKYLGLRWETIEKMQKRVEHAKSVEIAIFVTRAIPGLPSLAVSIFCGLARVPLIPYLIASFLGCLPRNFILGMMAWWGGQQYDIVVELISNFESHLLVVIAAVMVSVIVGWMIFKHKRLRVLAVAETAKSE